MHRAVFGSAIVGPSARLRASLREGLRASLQDGQRALLRDGQRALAGVLALAALGGLTAATAGCAGYHVAGRQGTLGSVHRVAVEPLQNESYEPGVDVLVTDALVRELARRRDVEVVRDPARADLVLEGAVLPLSTRSRSFSSVELALEYEVELDVSLKARRSDGTTFDFDPTMLRDWELYLASADIEAERKNREEAIRRLAALLARRVNDALEARLGAR
jgi:hypothetical protein